MTNFQKVVHYSISSVILNAMNLTFLIFADESFVCFIYLSRKAALRAVPTDPLTSSSNAIKCLRNYTQPVEQKMPE